MEMSTTYEDEVSVKNGRTIMTIKLRIRKRAERME